jgi:hypothetical protein
MGALQTTRGKIIAGAIAAIVLAAFLWLVIWLSLNNLWPIARDIALVLLALVTFVPLLALTYAVIELARTVRELKRELTPLLEELRETTQSVRDTARVANDLTVKPAIRTASFLVGFSQAMSIVLGRGTAARRQAARRRRAAAAREAAAREEARHDGAG